METTRRLNRPTPDRLLVVQPPEEVAQVCRQAGAQKLVHALVHAPANDGGPAKLLCFFLNFEGFDFVFKILFAPILLFRRRFSFYLDLFLFLGGFNSAPVFIF
jgi:hypothetical protein